MFDHGIEQRESARKELELLDQHPELLQKHAETNGPRVRPMLGDLSGLYGVLLAVFICIFYSFFARFFVT